VYAQIVSTGSYLPGEPITNADIEEMVGALPGGMLEGMHMQRRFWIIDPETGGHRDSTSGMAANALRQALERAGLVPGDVELLIVATATGDYLLPPTPTLVQEKLGIDGCSTLEIRSGGAGVVQGLDIARLYLERGIYQTVAVIGADAISPVQAQLLGREDRRLRVRDRLLMYMFGDGAGAIVMRAGDTPGVIAAASQCIGNGRPPGMEVRGGGGTHAPYLEQLASGRPVDLRIDIEAASTFTATLTLEGIANTLRAAGVEADAIDHLVTPEADTDWMAAAFDDNPALARSWAPLLAKVRNALPAVGAPGCAALPIGLDHAVAAGQLQAGQRIMLLGMETTKWIYAGMVLDWTA
jgi:3-oxoacyl-[acyl-carrier-protein] synthase-3